MLYMHPQSPTYGNAYRSALEVGYSESYALTITDKAPWLSEIIGNDSQVTVEEVIAGLKAETQFKDGKASGAFVRLRAWELIGKHKKMFMERSGINAPGATINILSMSNEQLSHIIANRADQPAGN